MENDNPRKMKLQIISVIELFVFLFDIYAIVNMTKNYQILGIAGCLTLVWSIITINTWLKWKEKEKQRSEEQYVDIMKAEKSTHLVSQKRFQDLDEKLNFIGQKIMPLEKSAAVNQKKIANMLEDLMDGQKKVAKITISRSKENANALMNSNDQLVKQMGEFQQSILDMKEEVLAKQNQIYEQKIHKMDENQKELFEKIQEASSILKNVIDEIPENISKISPPAVNNAVVEEKIKQESGLEPIAEPVTETLPEEVIPESVAEPVPEERMPEVIPELVAETLPEEVTPGLSPESVVESESIPEPMAIAESILEEEMPEPIPEPVIEPEPIPEPVVEPEPISEDPNKAMSPEDIAALLANTGEMASEPAGLEAIPEAMVEAAPESVAVPEPTVEMVSEPMVEPELIPEPVVEPEPIPEPIVGPEPISEDPNKAMSPEDIAALLASAEDMMMEEPEPEPEVIIEPEAIVIPEPTAVLEPEPKAEDPNKIMSPEDIAALLANTTAEVLPETAEKIVEEEKPPMPDVSDPGKMMSPEDIAALIANM
ncbi:MAG: hypothetical protein HFH41_13625 [Lachnospiraceae bacterium]|nr:hypothetical protein [Lachnospiraceae bacterium]